MLQTTLEKQRQLYVDLSQRAVAWETCWMNADVRRDMEDAIAVGLLLLESIRRRAAYWLSRAESGLAEFDRTDRDAIIEMYKQWLDASCGLLRAVDMAEQSYYYIEQGEVFRRRCGDISVLLNKTPVLLNELVYDTRPQTGDAATKAANLLMETRSGKLLCVTDISPADINWRDIAHSLSLICRFSGHCCRFYSVAAHSLHCYYAARDVLQLAEPLCICMLLHDAGEAFWGDLGRPHKAAPHMSSYKSYLATAQRAVYRAARVYAVAVNAGPIMRYIDMGILKEEARRLMRSKGAWNFPPYADIQPMRIPTLRWVWFLFPTNARRRFLKIMNHWMSRVERRVRQTSISYVSV